VDPHYEGLDDKSEFERAEIRIVIIENDPNGVKAIAYVPRQQPILIRERGHQLKPGPITIEEALTSNIENLRLAAIRFRDA